jgi:hypothetical protein
VHPEELGGRIGPRMILVPNENGLFCTDRSLRHVISLGNTSLKEFAESRFMTTERENTCLEISVQRSLESIGISLISEWDMLAFVYRHGPSLTSTEQIAKLIGYESAAVGAALERLEGQKLIERVGPTKGVRLHRMRAHAGHQPCLLHLVSLSENRAGRLLLKKLLKPIEPGAAGNSTPTGPESEGKRND